MNWQQISEWLENAGKRVGVPILIVALISVGVGIANYRLQTRGNRPDLASAGPRIVLSAHPMVIVYWSNIGRKVAQRGEATLFTVSEDGKHEKMGHALIVGAGTNVFPGYNGTASFGVDMQKFLGTFLVCATYFDDANVVYQQAFQFRIGAALPGDDIRALDEMAPVEYKMCL